LEEIKTDSSKWMKKRAEELSDFYWQDGYTCLSVNPSEVDTVTHKNNVPSSREKNVPKMNTEPF